MVQNQPELSSLRILHTMKWIHLIVSILFLSFAIMQWNDSDALLWMVMYTVVSGVAFLAFRNKHHIWVNAGLVAIMMVAFISYIPSLRDWISDGMPTITDAMQASSPYIELVREGLGLLLSLITMIIYLILAKRNL